MKTTQEILKVLRTSYWIYDHYREQWFFRWCIHCAENNYIPVRTLFKHDGLRNWYCDMWLLHVEKMYVKENQDFFTLNEPLQLLEILALYPSKIEQMYPKSLVEIIKKENHAIPNHRRSKRENNSLK